jgi:hypothetical protein
LSFRADLLKRFVEVIPKTNDLFESHISTPVQPQRVYHLVRSNSFRIAASYYSFAHG